jgi:hypothetical protein
MLKSVVLRKFHSTCKCFSFSLLILIISMIVLFLDTLGQNDLVTRIQRLERENAELKEIKKPRPSLSNVSK